MFFRPDMDDLARPEGMSRSGLHHHRRNKEDIFRPLVARTFDQALNDRSRAPARPGLSAEQAHHGAFHAKDSAEMEMVLSEPHGAELLETSSQGANDIVLAGEAEFERLLAAWLAGQVMPEGPGTPDSISSAILQALKG